MRSSGIATVSSVRALGQGAIATATAVLLLSASLMAVGAFARGSASRAVRERAGLGTRATAAESAISAMGTLPPDTSPQPQGIEGALDAFQAILAASCVEHGVRLVSVEAGSESATTASRYTDGAAGPAAVKSVETKVQLRGRLTDVYTVLSDLKRLPAPIELASMDLEGDGGGGVRVGLDVTVISGSESAAPTVPVALAGGADARRR